MWDRSAIIFNKNSSFLSFDFLYFIFTFLLTVFPLFILKFVEFGDELPGLSGFFFVDRGDGKAGVDEYKFADANFRQQRSLYVPAVAHRIGNGVIAMQFNYPCRYGQTHIIHLLK